MILVETMLGVIFSVLLGVIAGQKTQKEPEVQSVGETKTLEFMEKKFELKFKDTDKPVKIYEYFSGKDTPDNWIEMMEFQIYPMNREGNEPMDFAKRIAAAFIKNYPYMKYSLLSEEKTGSALLDFFYPESTRKEKNKEFIEFNAFKFYREPGGNRTIAVHYAKNIENTKTTRKSEDVVNDIRKTRSEIIPALAKFPNFSQ